MSDTGVGILVVGLGNQGRRHVRVARSSDVCRVIATVDPNSGPLGDMPNFPTISAALEATAGSIEAAIVASPPDVHYASATPLLEAGIPTLVEKPITATTDQAIALLEVAERTGTQLFVGHVERFNPCVQLVKALLDGGSIGAPLACSFMRVGLPPRSKIEIDVIQDLAVHDIDIFGYLTDAEPRLAGAAGWVGVDALIESAHILMRTPNVHGLVEVNWRTPVRLRSFTVTTDTCFVRANYTLQSVEIVEASAELDLDEFAAFRSHYGAARTTQLETVVAEPLAEQLSAFAAAVRGDPGQPLASARDGVRALSLAAQASDAALSDEMDR